MKDYIPLEMFTQYQHLVSSPLQLPCFSYLTDMEPIHFRSLMSSMVMERMLRKQEDVLRMLGECGGDWKETLFRLLAAGFGFKTNVVGKSFHKWVSDEPFHSTDACISCGKCVSVCPLQNITLEDGRPKWHGNCTNCDACFHHCPRNAIQYGKASVGKKQYYFGII